MFDMGAECDIVQVLESVVFVAHYPYGGGFVWIVGQAGFGFFTE